MAEEDNEVEVEEVEEVEEVTEKKKIDKAVKEGRTDIGLKYGEYLLLLITLLAITSYIIKGIPPSERIKGVSTEVPKAIWMYGILCYIIMVTIKVITDKGEKVKPGIGKQIGNMLIYFLITVLAYTFCVSYLCMKIRRRPIQIGGFWDWMEKGEGETRIDPSIQLIIFVGVLLVIVNTFTNLYLYLKSKEENEEDRLAKTIYISQITILIFMILTILFLFILSTNMPSDMLPSWDEVSGIASFSSSRGEWFKLFMFVLTIVVVSVVVHLKTNTKFLFGL